MTLQDLAAILLTEVDMGRASILISITLALALASPAISSAQGKSEAKQRFQKGVKLFKKGNHEGALVEFRAAYDAKPHWKVRYNIGMTLYKLNRYVEADVELRAYLLEGGDSVPEKTLTEVQSILFEIQSYIGTVNVSCDVMGAKIYVDGVLVSTYPLEKPLPLDVGEYVFELRAEGQDPISKKVAVPGGKEITAEFTFVEADVEPVDEPEVEPVVEPVDGPVEEPAPEPGKKKSSGKGLLIAGSVTAGLGILAIPAAIGFYASEWLWDAGIAFSVVSGAALAAGIPMIIVGAIRYKRWKKEKAGQGLLFDPGPLVAPYIAPIRGGGLLGIAATF